MGGNWGNVESTIKIAKKGLPIVYAVIGAGAHRFKPLVDAYRKVARNSGHDPKKTKVATHSWGWIADDHDKAVEEYYHPTKVITDNIAKDRPHWSEMTKAQYLYSLTDEGATIVGDPKRVAEKLSRLLKHLTWTVSSSISQSALCHMKMSSVLSNSTEQKSRQLSEIILLRKKRISPKTDERVDRKSYTIVNPKYFS